MIGRRLVTAVFVLVALALAALPSIEARPAASPSVKVKPVLNGGQVLASFSAPGAYGDDARKLTHTGGLLLTFTYTVELRQSSTIWLDRTLASVVVAATVTYDSLTKRYQVSRLRDGRVEKAQLLDKEDAVKDWMTEFEPVPIVPSEPLQINEDYYLQVRLRATPRLHVSIWPFGQDDGSGRQSFTFIR